MLLTKVKYNRSTETYTIDLSIPLTSFTSVRFKFDTGASSTMITTASLCDGEEDMAKLAYFLESCRRTGKYISKPLYSAYGDGKTGILCHIKDFVFPGEDPFTFYFYLIYSTDHIKALLGADFISCCDCNFKANEDIKITRFHNSVYEGKFGFASKSGSLDFVKVMTILPKIQLPKEFEKFKTSNRQIDLQKVYDFLGSVDDLDLQEFINSLDSIDDWKDMGEVSKHRGSENDDKLKKMNSFKD